MNVRKICVFLNWHHPQLAHFARKLDHAGYNLFVTSKKAADIVKGEGIGFDDLPDLCDAETKLKGLVQSLDVSLIIVIAEKDHSDVCCMQKMNLIRYGKLFIKVVAYFK
ncbi:hypothetical protein EON65_50540, partial [archaeon]